MEREPVLFLGRELASLLAPVRARVSRFLHADPDGLVFVPNATAGVNAVLRSLRWQPGDEILLADMTYNAVKETVRYLEDSFGVVGVRATIPFPLEEPAQIVAAFAGKFSPRTRLLLVDHVVSPTALVCPAADLVALGHTHGVPVLVDGAHAPGLLPLDLDALGADFYTGNLHKWAYAPKGSAILQVAAPWRELIHANTVSHGYRRGLHAEFDFSGTFDPSAWLAIPTGLDVLESLPGLQERCHALVQEGRRVVAGALGVDLPHPDDPRLYASMAAIPVPAGRGEDAFPRTAAFFERHHIEVSFMAYDERLWVRISANAYNHPDDYRRLAAALGG